MTAPRPHFSSSPSRLGGELEDRIADGKRLLPFCVEFLDDYLRGISPTELVVIGAPTGIGKTDLALSIGSSNAFLGRRVHYFALEAEDRELERRTKYTLLARQVYTVQHPRRDELNYTDWRFGLCEHIVGEFNRTVDQQILEKLATLRTFYRGSRFGLDDLARGMLEVHQESDLLIVDHLHYVDVEDENENRGLGDVVKATRDISLHIGKPVILVVHLRKSDARMRRLVATVDDIHGTSNVGKIATQVVTLAPAREIESPKWYLAPTYIAIPKDRRSGACPFVAVANYDRRHKRYRPEYTLGLERGGKWEQLKLGDVPRWARGHRPLATTPGAA